MLKNPALHVKILHAAPETVNFSCKALQNIPHRIQLNYNPVWFFTHFHCYICQHYRLSRSPHTGNHKKLVRRIFFLKSCQNLIGLRETLNVLDWFFAKR